MRKYVEVRDGFEIKEIYEEIDEMENKVKGDVKKKLYKIVGEMLKEKKEWVMRNEKKSEKMKEMVGKIKRESEEMEKSLEGMMKEYMKREIKEEKEELMEKGE